VPDLVRGANAPLDAPRVAAGVLCALPADVSALLVGSDMRVRSDADLVFYNAPENGGVRWSDGGGGQRIDLDLAAVAADAPLTLAPGGHAAVPTGIAIALPTEQHGSQVLRDSGVSLASGNGSSGGNMSDKEVRYGIAPTVNWVVATTNASNGSVNAMHDSFTPLGGLVPMWLMQLGEVIFGGVGSGLYGMLAFAVVAVFIAGLMVGRTPEYLGKKIEAYEMKMASLAVLVPCALVTIGTAIAVLAPAGVAGVSNPGAHGFSEILYAVSSASNNNGSAFGGLSANTPFWNILLAVCMFLARFPLAIAMLAMAGSLAAKRHVPPSAGTLRTHTPLFVVLLACIVVVVGALTFLPALALGPIAEHLQAAAGH